MKVFAAALAALMLVSTASAQTTPATPPSAPQPPIPASRCPDFPPNPTLPDGATARNSREMQAGETAYQAWGQQMQSVLDCRRAEAEELLIQARTHEARVREFNDAVSRLNSVGQAWQAEAAEYNGRRH